MNKRFGFLLLLIALLYTTGIKSANESCDYAAFVNPLVGTESSLNSLQVTPIPLLLCLGE